MRILAIDAAQVAGYQDAVPNEPSTSLYETKNEYFVLFTNDTD